MTLRSIDATELMEIRDRVLGMGARVEAIVERSMRALDTVDEELARRTIVQDRRVNQDEIDIDAACMALILEGNLDVAAARLIMATAKMVADLKRISDSLEGKPGVHPIHPCHSLTTTALEKPWTM